MAKLIVNLYDDELYLNTSKIEFFLNVSNRLFSRQQLLASIVTKVIIATARTL